MATYCQLASEIVIRICYNWADMLMKFLKYSRPLTLPFAFGWTLMLVVLFSGRNGSDFDYFFSSIGTKLLFGVLTAASIILLIAYGMLFLKWLERKAHHA